MPILIQETVSYHPTLIFVQPKTNNTYSLYYEVFVRRNGRTGRADIILLDHGLYEELPENVRGPLCEFWEATVLRNEVKMQAAAEKIGIADYMRFAEVLFQQPIRIRGGRIRGKLSQADIDHMQEIARKNFELIMGTLKEMPRSMLFVVSSACR